MLIRGPATVFVGTSDWSQADGAILTDDDEVVPMIELGTALDFEITSALD